MGRENSPKNLDPSFKMDLDFFDCFRKEKTVGRENSPKNLGPSFKVDLYF